MSTDDVAGDTSAFVVRAVIAEPSVSLARCPEVNVFVAELFLEKFLKINHFKIAMNTVSK